MRAVDGDALRIESVPPSVARQAVRDWHYSRSYPAGVNARYGVWEDGRFIGAVIFGTGSNVRIGDPYGLQPHQVRELVRIALDKHVTPVSRIIAATVRMFRGDFPAVDLIVSYADPVQGHHGGVYQANNWSYLGPQRAHATTAIVINGEQLHERTCASRYGTQRMALLREIDPGAHRVKLPRKHVYVYGQTKSIRKMYAGESLPYPKREGHHMEFEDVYCAKCGGHYPKGHSH